MLANPYEVWQWRDGFDTAITTGTQDFTGFTVEATDGCVGVVDQSSSALGTTCLVVDNEQWIAGRKMLLPAGTVAAVDTAAQLIRLNRSKAQVEASPEYDPDTFARPHYLDMVAHHFAGTYNGADVPQ
ncbi:PRC-barrel domain containing protein [Dactylosporangium aurantiacum]|uniref:PRC-barrel domain containing protein n=1 Tax=Dactylosporangium aurantiacum TaxID=35754 RepID=A0A9Q9IRT0_9ACTN|nr:PRC-barrel domain containing protein [Dactylosporangium aurantiacum]MDG6110401.1 PRC-barrel domain containing protein [Dactylosporangium aurantiacum]UWZ58612.1 PRC-barrel domain containing protein [Dactylosporangium aurantiacum]